MYTGVCYKSPLMSIRTTRRIGHCWAVLLKVWNSTQHLPHNKLDRARQYFMSTNNWMDENTKNCNKTQRCI